jgi:hypothetical protein
LANLRDRSFKIGLLAGARQAVMDLSRACSRSYEVKDEPLPTEVDKALTYMSDALKRGQGTKGKLELYLIGAAMLGEAMGEASYQKGFDAGRRFTEPSTGEMRVDMSEREIRDLAYLADVGFHHVIEGGRASNFHSAADAEHASNAINILESQLPPVIEDDPYAFSWNRQTSIWDKWPREQPDGKGVSA